MDVVPHKQLWAEPYYYVMINAPMTLIRLQKSDGRSDVKQAF